MGWEDPPRPTPRRPLPPGWTQPGHRTTTPSGDRAIGRSDDRGKSDRDGRGRPGGSTRRPRPAAACAGRGPRSPSCHGPLLGGVGGSAGCGRVPQVAPGDPPGGQHGLIAAHLVVDRGRAAGTRPRPTRGFSVQDDGGVTWPGRGHREGRLTTRRHRRLPLDQPLATQEDEQPAVTSSSVALTRSVTGHDPRSHGRIAIRPAVPRPPAPPPCTRHTNPASLRPLGRSASRVRRGQPMHAGAHPPIRSTTRRPSLPRPPVPVAAS